MFNVYAMNEFEREMAIAEKVYDIAMSEVAYMEAMIDSKLRINMAKSELKVMQESSEESCIGDLAYLFNEAAKEAEAQSQGVFAKIKTSVVNFITSVWNSIQKLWSHQDTEAYQKMIASKQQYEAPCNIGFFMTAGEAVNNIASGGISGIGERIKSIGPKLGIAAGAGISLKIIYDKIMEKSKEPTKCTGKQLADWMETIKKNNFFSKFLSNSKNVTEEESSNAEANKPEDSSKNENSGSWLSRTLQAVTSFGSKSVKFIESVANAFKADVDKIKDNKENKKTGAPKIDVKTSQQIKDNEKYSSQKSADAKVTPDKTVGGFSSQGVDWTGESALK